ITVFPIFPNLVHLNLQDIKIGTCFKSINVKGLMPQLKTLKVKRLQIGLCKYCNWKQVIQAAELCDFDDSKPLLIPFPHSSSWHQQNRDCSTIKFLNHLLLSCPNLLALYYFGTHRISEEILEIPSTLEWLIINGDTGWHGPFSVRLDLSQCKHINGLSLSWNPSFVKWPTETMLKIGWLKIERQEDIKYWDDLLSLPTKPCDVKLCALRSTMNIYDLTSDNSIFPHQSRFTSEQTIAKKPGINYRDAERFLKCRKNTKVKQLLHYSSNHYQTHSKEIDTFQRSMLFFKKVVKIMGIDNTKVEEYQRWFDINEARWILDLLW
ncbi:hypothetical protein RFI_07410, partial [Reticulomyxa filosa]